MAIEVRCECGKVLNVADKHAGKTGKCPACGRMLHIVASGAQPTPDAGAGLPPTPAQPPPPPSGLPPMPGQPTGSSLPWQEREKHGFAGALLETIGAVLFKPGQAFSSVRIAGSLPSSLVYLLILGTVGAYVSMGVRTALQSAGILAGPDIPVDPELMAMTAVAWVIAAMVVPVIIVLCSFIGAGIMHLLLMMFGGANESFEATYSVTAYTQGSTALLGLLALLPYCIGSIILLVWTIVISTVGLTRVHHTDMWRAALAVIVPIVICCGMIIAAGVALGVMAIAAAQRMQ